MIAPARQAALRVLQQIDRGATLADALVRERDRLADARDRALVTEIASGVLRWKGRLDHLLAAHSARAWPTVDPTLQHVLRLAAYQLVQLDRIPARAAVDDAVEQAREAGLAKATGFVNGVLRNVLRARDRNPDSPDAARFDALDASRLDSADPDTLAALLSLPQWLLDRRVRRHGRDAAIAWARFDNEAPALTLRANRLRTTREALAARLADEGVATGPTPFANDGVRVVSGDPLGSPAMREGLFVVQDEASQLVGELAAAFAGPRMLDTCAAPGGKTLALAAAAPPDGFVVAADRRPRRLRLLRQTLTRTGAAADRIVQIDLRRALPFPPRFDLVLLDAPCSGLGTVRREPDIKWRRSEADLAVLADAQGDMLQVASRAVAPGGRLVYATCSSEPEENDEVVDAFLARHPEFEAVTPPPGALPPGLAQVVDAGGRLRTLPHRHGLEAFFAAVLRRRARETPDPVF